MTKAKKKDMKIDRLIIDDKLGEFDLLEIRIGDECQELDKEEAIEVIEHFKKVFELKNGGEKFFKEELIILARHCFQWWDFCDEGLYYKIPNGNLIKFNASPMFVEKAKKLLEELDKD